MELNIYDIIKHNITTTKSIAIRRKLKQFTFKVNSFANKIMIRQAVEKIWPVKVDKIHIINVKGKNKEFARKSFKSPGMKKAIVSLKTGYTIDLPGNFESIGISDDKSSNAGIK